mmetsp:Transcript_14820/g.14283  ORF Transcript_14820/g.14283 Transcript_14820/m.14283 type:complete len:130 (-) Transcript_14820:439-828(-)
MWHGMQLWRNGEDGRPELPQSESEILNVALQVAYDEQSSTGWNHLCVGRIAVAWQRCIMMSLRNSTGDNNDGDNQNDESNGDNTDEAEEHTDGKLVGCIRDLVVNIWSMMLRMRRKRNYLIHGNDSTFS